MALTQHLKPTIHPLCSSFFHHSSIHAAAPFSLKSNARTHFFGSRIQSLHDPPPIFSRRMFLPSVSTIWDALTGGSNNAREAVLAIRRGMLLFRQGDVLGSLAEFDKAIELDPRQKAYLWQRGLSLYYLDRFEEGAEQFRLDVAQNPNDTEESIWCFLCEAQLYGADRARKQFLEVGRDPRPVMREAYNMFKEGGDPEKLAAAFSNSQANEYFYASLYAGLYYESQANPSPSCKVIVDPQGKKKADSAKLHILAAYQSPYGQRADDYMASLSKVHCLCRNWTSG